jgi:protein-S-isoprenylcysteine O-methyltransferase Ste14
MFNLPSFLPCHATFKLMFILLIFCLTWAVYIGFEIFLITRDARKFGFSNNNNAVFLTILIIAGVILAYLLSSSEFARLPGDRDAHIIAGTVITWSGILLRCWAIYTLGASFRTVIMVLKGQPVIKAGPYKWIRHPSYTGVILIFSGLAITLGNLIGLIIVGMLITMGYCWRILIEEQVLLSWFGKEYLDYIKKTKKLVPFIY